MVKNSFASHEKAKYWSKKNDKTPDEVNMWSKDKYLFDCNVCGHDFEKIIQDLNSRNSWCPYCSKRPKLCKVKECTICFDKSFAIHEKSKYWSDQNELKPWEITISSGQKCWFKCGDCDHEFNAIIRDVSRTDGKQSWCRYCMGNDLCGDNNCKMCFEKSFSSHEKSEYWSDKNEIKSNKIKKYTNTKIYFDCPCGHEFKARLDSISNGQWCPFCCTPVQKLCEDENCKNCFERSFASHEKSKYWSDENELNPRQLAKYTHEKFKFICENGHDYISSLAHVSNGKWCSICRLKTEQKVYEFLKTKYNKVEAQRKFNDFKSDKGRHYSFDFVLENEKTIIEIDGPQHFEQVQNWESNEQNFRRDLIKCKYALDNNYKMIRVYQPDIFNDAFNWKNMIESIIELEEDKDISFLANTNVYDIYKIEHYNET